MNNWMELRLTKDEEDFVKRNAATYRAVYVETIDTIFGWAKSIDILKKRYDGSGIQGRFADALVQYGFTSRDGGPMLKSIRSNLKTLLDNEQAVRAWWAKVPEKAKRDWNSPRAIHRHWEASLKPPEPPRRPDVTQPARPAQREAEAKTLAEREVKADTSALDRLREEKRTLETKVAGLEGEIADLKDLLAKATKDEGLIGKEAYNNLRFCLHEDRVAKFNDPGLTQRFKQAAQIINTLKSLLSDEKAEQRKREKAQKEHEQAEARARGMAAYQKRRERGLKAWAKVKAKREAEKAKAKEQ